MDKKLNDLLIQEIRNTILSDKIAENTTELAFA